MIFVLLFLALVLVGIGFYLYFFLRRTLSAFGVDVKKRPILIALITVSVLMALSSLAFSGFVLIVYLHVIAASLLCRLIHFIVCKCAGKKRTLSGWQKVYKSGVIPVLLAALLLVGGVVNLYTVNPTYYTVSTDKDIRQQGYRIALVADVHFGVSLDEEALLQKCDEISQSKPDLVVLCGDIVDNDTTVEEMYRVFAALGTIESKLGIYYVYGNHDRSMSMLASDFSDQELNEVIASNGITVLQDDVVPIADDLVIVGREDRSRDGRAELSKLFEEVNKDAFVLTLDHQPNEYKENGACGTDLLLSGHTHGGQIFPINYVQELIPFNDGVYGMYTLSNGGKAIVTSGFGTWSYPSKTAGKSEYVIIDVTSTK